MGRKGQDPLQPSVAGVHTPAKITQVNGAWERALESAETLPLFRCKLWLAVVA